MPGRWEQRLERWIEAGLIDAAAGDRIREFERARASTPRLRLSTILVLAFGGVLLGAGVLLFVASHWDAMPPMQRLALVVAVLGAMHACGAMAPFPALSTTLHAVGTISLGGAIAMAGQIFNMAEHWPAAILLWALGSWAGAVLLRDWPQIAMAAVLTPAWLAGEVLARSHNDDWKIVAGFVFLLAIVYMSGKPPWNVLGSIAILPAAAILMVERTRDAHWWLAIPAIAIPATLAWIWHRERALRFAYWLVWPPLVILAAADRSTLLLHLLYAAGSALMVWWGIQDRRPLRVNLGIAGFGITVLSFYFSNVMSMLNRSLSLILLGVLFLAGGWALERLRRKLIREMPEEAA